MFSIKPKGASGAFASSTGIRVALLVATALLASMVLVSCTSQPSSSSGGTVASQGESGEAERTGRVGDITSFTTVTLDGETFTQDEFAPYDLTMVNIWSTSCGFCIDEMPALEMLYQSLPQNVNMVAICADARLNAEAAHSIVDAQGVTYPVLSDSLDLNEALLSKVTGTPTTIFVDDKGALVGDVQRGVPSRGGHEEVAQAYRTLIDEHLAELS